MLFIEQEKCANESSAQYSIRHAVEMLAGFQSVIPADTKDISSQDYKEGELQFYQYITGLYVNLYKNPKVYKIDSEKYDEYMASNERKEKKGKFLVEKQHFQDSKESSLCNQFQQSISFYFKFLYELGCVSRIRMEDFSLEISKDSYRIACANTSMAKIRKDQKERIMILLNTGLGLRECGNSYIMTCEKYPKMFIGLVELCNAPDSKYKYMNYLRLDYKRIRQPIPEIADIMETLKEEMNGNINRLINALQDEKYKVKVKPLRNITSGFQWKVEFTVKGKSCLGFYADRSSYLVCIYFNKHENISAMASYLEGKDKELFQWFCDHIPERLCRCPNNRWVTLGSNRRRICGMSNRLDVVNPNAVDMKKCLKVLRIFRGYIGGYKDDIGY